MGLDTVELVIRFEDAFGISIPDKVAAELTTPRKVTDYIISQVAMTSQSSCLSQQAFYFLRKKFVGVLGIPRAEFLPDNKLERFIPLEGRRQDWLKLKHELGASSLPILARPVWLFGLLVFVSIVSFVIASTYAWTHGGGVASSLILGLLVSSVTGYLGAIATRPLQRNFRKGYSRPRDLAKFLVVNNPRCFKKEWTRDQVAQTVREIIVDETGVSDFAEDSHFVKDMNLA